MEREISGKVGMKQWGTHVGMGKTTWAGGQTLGSLGDKSEVGGGGWWWWWWCDMGSAAVEQVSACIVPVGIVRGM